MLEFVRRFCIEVCRYTTFVSQRDTNTKERYVNKLLTIGNLPANSLLVTLDVSSLYTNALISGHPGGLTPGTYGGIARGFADFCCQFLARDGGIGPLLHSRGKIHGERPAGFVTLPPS